MPTVSVIIPTYNRASRVRDAVRSVLSQSYSDYEVLVVDDGSTDNTREVVTELSKLSTKLRYVCQTNQGRSAARNHGIRLAQGKYVAFLDSDDRFLPEKLALQTRSIEEDTDYGMAYSDVIAVDEGGRLLAKYHHPRRKLSGWIYPDILFLRGTAITTPSVLVRYSVLADVGMFDETMHVCEDLDLWRRVARRYRVLQIEQPLCIVSYRMAEQVPLVEWVEARTLYYEKAISEDPALERAIRSRLFAEMYFWYGGSAVWHKNIRLGLCLFARSVRANPVRFPLHCAYAGYQLLRTVGVRCVTRLGRNPSI